MKSHRNSSKTAESSQRFIIGYNVVYDNYHDLVRISCKVIDDSLHVNLVLTS